MAFRRSLTARANLLHQQRRRFVDPFPHINNDDRQNQNHNPNNFGISTYFQRDNLGVFHGSRNLFLDRRFAIPATLGPVLVRNMSSIGESPAEGSEVVSGIANVFGDEAVGGEVANEVAIAISIGDSSFPVAAVQYLIDYVHCYTGFNWWASIAVTTALIRFIQLPLWIWLKKDARKALPRGKKIMDEIERRDMSPAAVEEGYVQTKELVKEYFLFAVVEPVIGGCVHCCLFFALKNMAQNVPSFKEGGAFWFMDLTTPDSMYIFPILTALSFYISMEVGVEVQEASTINNALRVCSALTIPLTATFPKAVFCYLLTCSLFSRAYRSVLRNPEVVKLLGLPMKQASADKKPSSKAPKKYAEAAQEKQSLSSSSSKPANQKIGSLEREVKESKKDATKKKY